MAVPDNRLPCAGCRALNSELRREQRDASRALKMREARIVALETAIDVVLRAQSSDSRGHVDSAVEMLRSVR